MLHLLILSAQLAAGVPCPGQPDSLKQLERAFKNGRAPSPEQLTGTWVAVGWYAASAVDVAPAPAVRMDCDGVLRDDAFEAVLFADGYAIQPFFLGAADHVTFDATVAKGDVTFRLDLGGEADTVYRCRLTTRGTLACLLDVYRQGFEFRRASWHRDEIVLSRDRGGASKFPGYDAPLLTRADEELLLEVGKRMLKDNQSPSCVWYVTAPDMLGDWIPVSPWLLNRLQPYRPGLVNCTTESHDELFLGPVSWITPGKTAHIDCGGFSPMVGRGCYVAEKGSFGRWRLTAQIRE